MCFIFDISTWVFLHHITNVLTDQISDNAMEPACVADFSSQINFWQTPELQKRKKDGYEKPT